MEGGGHPFGEPGGCQLPIAALGSLVVSDHPDFGAELFEQAGPLAGPERR